MMLIENNRLLNLGMEDDTHSIQNQEIDVTFPDSVDDRNGTKYRTNVNTKLATKNKSRLNNDLNPNDSPSKTTLSNKGLNHGLRNNQTEEALIYRTVDSTDSLKPNRISEFKQSLVTGASTTESKELPALHQKHLIKNINAQANHYGIMIEQQKRKIM